MFCKCGKLMTADERYEIRGKIKHVKKVPQGVERSNLHLVIKYPVQPDIHKYKEVSKHSDDIAEAHPFDLMAFIFIIIILKLLERLQAVAPDLKEIAQQGDREVVKALYSLIADLINCNDDGLVFTGAQIEGECNMSLYDLIFFIRAYFDFIKEIQEVKN